MRLAMSSLQPSPAASSRILTWAAALLVSLLSLWRVLHLQASPDDILVSVLPDDAFYYMKLAMHRAAEGRWTFDGRNAATGFHLLYGHLLHAIFVVSPDMEWRTLYRIVGVLASLALGLATWLTTRVAVQAFGIASLPLALAPFVSHTALVQSTLMMESWLVLLFAALTVHGVTREQPLRPTSVLGLLAVGALGSLSRTDFGMLPGVLTAVAFCIPGGKRSLLFQRSAVVLGGTVLGVILCVLHNHHVSGQITQASAQVKLHWSAMAGHSILQPLGLLASVVFPGLPDVEHFGRPIKLIFAITAFVLGAALLKGWRARREHATGVTLMVGTALTLAAYVLFYSHNSEALQIWYAANLLVPVALLLAAVGHQLLRGHARWLAPVVASAYLLQGATHLFAVSYPQQAGLLKGAQYLNAHPVADRYGAWNAGILGYFIQKPVTNLDGLTNDAAGPHIQANTLLDYIVSERIHYIIDHEVMLSSAAFRRRGGYDDERALRCIRPLLRVDGDAATWGSSHLALFEVSHACLTQRSTTP